MGAVFCVLGCLYFAGNIAYTLKRRRDEGAFTLKQWLIGIAAAVPLFLGVMFMVWGLPILMPEKFRCGGDRIDE